MLPQNSSPSSRPFYCKKPSPPMPSALGDGRREGRKILLFKIMQIYKAKKSLGLKTFKFARAKKALGQHFLKSEPALKKIIEAGEVKKGDIILEIGPGRGALTEKLLERAG